MWILGLKGLTTGRITQLGSARLSVWEVLSLITKCDH